MMRKPAKEYGVLLLIFILPAVVLFGQGKFVTPISGTYGDDFIIVNYVDWGLEESILDAYCLSKTYDGHQGTDFVIRNFALMDTGVAVMAVDTGVVIFTQDGIFDREKSSDPAKGLGNYIGITHAGDIQTYYGHLRKNSLLVSVGDTVLPGQVIGLVGSSGNSEDPHLHFELWYDSLYVIDPYSGPCGNATSFWANEIPVDSAFHQWISGMVGFVPDLDTLREQPVSRDSFYQADEAITYWSLMYGLRKGDLVQVEWKNPDGFLWYSEQMVLDQDWWYYYYWSWINVPPSQNEGPWMVRLFQNGTLIEERPFYVSEKTSPVLSPATGMNIHVQADPGVVLFSGDGLAGCRYAFLDVLGNTVYTGVAGGASFQLDTRQLVPGIYYTHIVSRSGEQQTIPISIR